MSARHLARTPITVEDARARALDCTEALFYAFGASYPDGSCHAGQLTDDDDDEVTEDGPPCPFCVPSLYDVWAAGEGRDDQQYVMVEPLDKRTVQRRG